MLLLSRLNGGFWLLWLSLLAIFYFNSSDDLTSIFYDRSRAYEQKYSLQRVAEAEAYLRHLPPNIERLETDDKFLCIGIPIINHTSESFLASTVATLVDSLTPQDRASIHLVVLLADRSPKNHFAYRQQWLADIADEVLLYGEVPASTNQKTYRTVPYNVFQEGPGRGTGRTESMRLDHSVLVETCRQHGSPYFALVEDDIVASPHWFAQLKKGLQYVETRSRRTGKDWIYLRLVYSELFMGWNNEEWLFYLQNIFLVYIALFGFLARILLRRRAQHASAKGLFRSSALFIGLCLGLCLPALIGLYFAAGRVSTRCINPFTWSWHPAREMPNYGCCAQGLVFPQRHLEGLQTLLRKPPYAFAGDQILEDYARDHSLAKWAVEPSVFQHVDLKKLSAGDQRAEVWNFSFERQHGQKEE